MLFEYDEHKNELNIEKHKVSFEEAQEIWDDPDFRVPGEKTRGKAQTRYWCDVYSGI